MPFPEELVQWVLLNRSKMKSYGHLLQMTVGFFLICFSAWVGRTPIHLLQNSSRTSGIVVDFKTNKNMSQGTHGSRMYWTSHTPIVEFQFENHPIRFQDYMGFANSREGVGSSVPVLFDAHNVAIAMIDRPTWKWIPWAPMMGLGFFLFVVGCVGRLQAKPVNQIR